MYRRNSALKTIKEGWNGNPVKNGKYSNLETSRHGIGAPTKWRFSLNPQRQEKRNENWNPKTVKLLSLNNIEHDSLVWLGHNSFYMQLDNKRMLFDPVFGHIPFVKRKSKMPTNPRLFKKIDILMLSHDHYDHLDKRSVKLLCNINPDMKILCGLGVGEIIHSWSPDTHVIEMGWYQRYDLGTLSVTFLPCQHWGKRGASDAGKRLWGAFMVQSSQLSIYYSGDTRFGRHFDEVKNLFGEPDYAMVGIGAYKPRWFMQPNHISPYEALDASALMGARITVPMHYGTFDLSDEPMGDPPKVFMEEAKARGQEVAVPMIGEVIELKPRG